MKNLLVHPGDATASQNQYIYDSHANIYYRDNVRLFNNQISYGSTVFDSGNVLKISQNTNITHPSGILITYQMDDCRDNRPGKEQDWPDESVNSNANYLESPYLYESITKLGTSNSMQYFCNHLYDIVQTANKYFYQVKRTDSVRWLVGPFNSEPGNSPQSHSDLYFIKQSTTIQIDSASEDPKIWVSEFQKALSITAISINYFDIINGMHYRKTWQEFSED